MTKDEQAAPVSAKTAQILAEMDRRWAGLPEAMKQPTGPGVHDMTIPMTIQELTRWLILRGTPAEDVDGYLLQYAGKTRPEMDEIYAAMHGSMA